MPLRNTAAALKLLKTLTACLALVAPFRAQALSFSNRYRSPRNLERPVRKATHLIVLHTTEAGARSSLNKLSERGEAHYCIDEKGVAYRIVDRNREAFHAGRSMWNGREECDAYSIGIEVVGYHNKPVTSAQIDSIRELLAALKKEYKIDDAHVLCHSHVAYGAPNKWQRRNHRGRKRCGMLFAMPSVRSRLGLKSKPAFDPDVRARRLVVGDQYLEKVLYGREDTMRGKIGGDAAPAGGGFFSSFFSKKPPEMPSEPEKENYYAKPPPVPKQEKPAEGAKAAAVRPDGGGKAAAPPHPAVPEKAAGARAPATEGAAPREPKSVKDLEDRMKYRELGVIGSKTTLYHVVGRNWNAATTYYCERGRIIRGDKVDPRKVKAGTRVFVRK